MGICLTFDLYVDIYLHFKKFDYHELETGRMSSSQRRRPNFVTLGTSSWLRIQIEMVKIIILYK